VASADGTGAEGYPISDANYLGDIGFLLPIALFLLWRLLR
jgi:hypothetical protein